MTRKRWAPTALITASMAFALLTAGSVGSATGQELPNVQTPSLPDTPSVPQVPSAPSVPSVPNQPAVPDVPSAPKLGTPQELSQAPSVSAPAGAGGGSAGAGSGAPSTAGSSPAASGFAPQQTPSAGSGGGAPASAATSASARRRLADERKTRAFRRTVRRLSGCFYALSGFERDVLVLRSGLRDGKSMSPAAVANRLDVPSRRVRTGERRGLRALRQANRSHGCGGGAALRRTTSGAQTLVSATTGGPRLTPLDRVETAARADRRTAHGKGGVLGESASGREPGRARDHKRLAAAGPEPSGPDAAPFIFGFIAGALLLLGLILALRQRPAKAYGGTRSNDEVLSSVGTRTWTPPPPTTPGQMRTSEETEPVESHGRLRAAGLLASGIASLLVGRIVGRRFRNRR